MKDFAQTVAIGDNEQIFAELKKPHVMAAVWTDAWSDISMAFVNNLVHHPLYVESTRREIPLAELSTSFDKKSAKKFTAELNHFQKLFKILGMEITSQKRFVDASRLETPLYNVRDVGDWHIDSSSLAILSVPFGPTTKYPSPRLRIEYNRYSVVFDEEEAEKNALSLPNNAIAIFKGYNFPNVQDATGEGFLHSRPTEQLKHSARFVLHSHIS